MARVLINHGWTNQRPTDHWQHLTATKLRQQGHQVQYPQYPETMNPSFDAWNQLLLAELQQQIAIGEQAGERIAIAHSLGCVNWLMAAVAGQISEPVDRLLLVAPADPQLLSELEGFELSLANPHLAEAVRASAKSVTLLGSDEDRWTPSGLQATFGSVLGVEAIIIEGAGHLTSAEGWGQWPGLTKWVNDAEADLRIR